MHSNKRMQTDQTTHHTLLTNQTNTQSKPMTPFGSHSEYGTLQEVIVGSAQEFAITPLGLEALDLLRIESGLIFAGYEFSDQTDPFEAGIGFTVPLKTKQDDFIGRDALLKRKANPQRKLAGLNVSGEQPANHGDGVYLGRNQIGIITSGMVSPILRKNIALCRVNVEHGEIGTKLEIGKLDGHQKRISCEVVAFPHYDPGKERVRG